MEDKTKILKIFVIALLIIFLISAGWTWKLALCEKFDPKTNKLTEVTLYTFSFIGTIVAGFYGVAVGSGKSFYESFGAVMPENKYISKKKITNLYIGAYLVVGILYLVGLGLNQSSDFFSKIVMSFLGLVTAIVSVYFKPE